MLMLKLFSIVMLAAAVPVFGQSFPDRTAPLPTRSGCLGCYGTDAVPVRPDSYVFLHAPVADGNGENGITLYDYGALPLNAFAGAGDVAAVRGETNALRRQLNRRVDRAAALASATDLQGPPAGSSNRVGGELTTIGGEVAGGANIVHQMGQVDVGGAVGFAKGSTLGKVSAGFAW